jgi:Cyclic nucleotide-binding domain/Protein of unknown function (FYDLN_acid)
MRKPPPSEEQLKDEVDVLRRELMFNGVAPSRLKLLALTSERLNFQSGQALFKAGDPCDAAYVVLSGSADLVVNSPSGEVKVATVEANSMIGSIFIYGHVVYNATVRANSALETLRIGKDQLLGLLAELGFHGTEHTCPSCGWKFYALKSIFCPKCRASLIPKPLGKSPSAR